VQVTLPPGTGPLAVGELNVQLTVSTSVPGGCSTVMVAEVNARSVMFSVQFGLGHSGAPGITAQRTDHGVPYAVPAGGRTISLSWA